jgi:hypothetical protein
LPKPDSFWAWYRRLVAKKFDGAQRLRYPGQPYRSAGVGSSGATNGTRIGDTIGSSARWPNWFAHYLIRRRQIFCVTTLWEGLYRRSHEGACWRRLLYGGNAHLEGLSERAIECCSSFIWTPDDSAWRVSPDIQIKDECNRAAAAQSRSLGDIRMAGMFCTIAIQNSAVRSLGRGRDACFSSS